MERKPILTTFERIQKSAKMRGLNLQQVAKKSGLKSENAIYRYNQGVTPRDSTLRAIAETLGVSFKYLKGDTDDPSTENNPTKADIADDDIIMTYEGREIPKEDLEIIKRLLRRD